MEKVKKGFWYIFWSIFSLGQIVAIRKAVALGVQETK